MQNSLAQSQRSSNYLRVPARERIKSADFSVEAAVTVEAGVTLISTTSNQKASDSGDGTQDFYYGKDA